MNYETFKKIIGKVNVATSITGKASYKNFEIQHDHLYFTRVNTQKKWKINLLELHKAYEALPHVDYKSVKIYLTGRVYSPGLAILIASGLYDKDGNKRV